MRLGKSIREDSIQGRDVVAEAEEAGVAWDLWRSWLDPEESH
jgi:hypothetical protein